MESSSRGRLVHLTAHIAAAGEASDDTHEEHIMIPVRDAGVRLSCALCRPKGAGRWPVLLTLHYAGTHPARGANADLARQGFAVADVVFR